MRCNLLGFKFWQKRNFKIIFSNLYSNVKEANITNCWSQRTEWQTNSLEIYGYSVFCHWLFLMIEELLIGHKISLKKVSCNKIINYPYHERKISSSSNQTTQLSLSHSAPKSTFGRHLADHVICSTRLLAVHYSGQLKMYFL